MDKTITQRAVDIMESVHAMDDLYSKDEVKQMLIRMAKDQMDVDAEEMKELNEEWEVNLDMHKALLIYKAQRWAEQQNFSVSVQLDLKKYLEE